MDEAERRAQIERYLDYSGINQDIAHEIYHDDAVLEFPQSGERFDGVENFREWRQPYPAAVEYPVEDDAVDADSAPSPALNEPGLAGTSVGRRHEFQRRRDPRSAAPHEERRHVHAAP